MGKYEIVICGAISVPSSGLIELPSIIPLTSLNDYTCFFWAGTKKKLSEIFLIRFQITKL